MAERRPLVIKDGRIEEFPVGDTLPATLGGNTYPDFSGNAGKFLRTNSTETGVEWQDVASTIAASDDMTIIPESLLPVDIGRPVGLIGLNSSVAEFGLLERPTINPMGGGIDVLGNYDLTALSQTSLVFPNADQYERIVIMGHDIVCSAQITLSLSSDNGATDLVHSLRRGRLFWNDTATPPITVTNTVTYETTSSIFLATNSTTVGGTTSVYAELHGLAAKTGLYSLRKDHFTVDAYNHLQTSISNTGSIVNAIRIWSTNSITGGRLVVYGLKQNAQPMPLSFDYSGTPGGAGRLARLVSPYGMMLRAGATGSFRVGSNPSGTETVDIRKNNVSIGSISITSGGVVTVSITANTSFVAGDLLTLDVNGTRTFTDLFGSFQSELTQ